MKKTLLATTALAFVAAHASAVDVQLYGQVNKGLFAFNDGQNTDTVVIDNSLSSTRFGFKGAQALDNGLTASVLFEGEDQSNASDSFVQNTTAGQSSTPANTTASFTQRQALLGLSGSFGGVYLGHQSTAWDGVLTQDLSGVQDVMNADYKLIGAGLQFRAKGTGALQTQTVGDLGMNADLNREDSVRYDSPIYNGFQGRLSVAQGGNMEGAVFYDGAQGDFKMKGAAGVRFINNGTAAASNEVKKEYSASFSVAHTSGLAGTLAYDKESIDNKAAGSHSASGWYAKVGYAWDAFEVAADYGHDKAFDAATTNNKMKSYGVGAQYNLGHGVSVAGLYRNYDAKMATDTDSIDLYGVNMRVKF